MRTENSEEIIPEIEPHDCCIPPLFFVWRYKFNGIVKSPKFSVKLSSEKINPVGRVSVNNDLDHDTAGYVRPRVEFS